MPRLTVLLLSLATLSAFAYGQNANPARPGTLNYIEGQASIEGNQLTSSSIGSTELQTDQTLSTANGKAEILLTPGVFLRLGGNTTVRMVSPNLTQTEVKLVQGRADVEVDQIYKQNVLLVDMPNGQTQLLKNGLYGFDVDDSTVRVFDGQAAVYPGAGPHTGIKPIEVKGGHQLALNGEPAKSQHFNKGKAEDNLYNWSSLRSQYLGEANVNLAEAYAGYPGFYPGWYWAGGPYGYTWLPGDGLFWNPFGYGFYSPYYIHGGGFIYGRYGSGIYPYRGGYVGGRAAGGGYVHGAVPAHSSAGFSGGNSSGFHGGSSGGFHGGGGGHR
ncbi:FecR domain-containing protein [Edaphobacter bradus]|uniref:FecR domain-containing protein n=1 Tax=Edaphobacter bradus TaxID=2259016 RepID=UPI0021DF4470|nr:FecR domain-containing protein [Edaphobacter bradus]